MDQILSDAEKRFLIDSVKDNIRIDGREAFDYRFFQLETDIISSCSGSGHIRLGNCEIMVGIKCELTEPSIDEPEQGIVEFFVDISPNACTFIETKKEIENNLHSLLNDTFLPCFNLNDLCILKGKHVWLINIDILVLELGSKANLYDSTAMAIKAALMTTKLPKVSINKETDEIEISDDPFDVVQLNVSDLPLILTVTRIGNRYIVDATQEEEQAGISSLIFAFNANGEIVHSRKISSGSLLAEPIKETLEKIKCLSIKLHNDLLNTMINESKRKKSTNKISFLI